MAVAPGVFVQLQANSAAPAILVPQQRGFMGFQCLPSEGVCVPVQALTTYDQNVPLYDTVEQCQRECRDRYGVVSWGGGDLDVDPGPKKAPK